MNGDDTEVLQVSPTSDRRLAPWDVFTPRAIAGDLMFINRAKDGLGERLARALNEMGAQVVLYGDTGVGKTSLILRVGGDRVVRIECQRGKSFRELLLDVFGSMGVVTELRFEESEERGARSETATEVGLGSIALLKARIGAKTSEGRTREFEVVQQPIVDVLVEAMNADERSVLFFDNFENVDSDDAKRSISELMVALADRAHDSGNVKVVIAGIADATAELLRMSDATARRTIGIHAETMSILELGEIVTRGMRLLRLQADEPEVQMIARLSAGYPYVAHLISLHAARHALRGNFRSIQQILPAAINDAVEDFHLELEHRYVDAVERSGPIRPRQRLLHALAASDATEFTYDEALGAVRARYGGEVRRSYFNAAIGLLCTDRYGRILRKESNRGRNRYSFRNPLARAFIRLKDASLTLAHS